MNWGLSQEELREPRGGTGTGVKDAPPWRKWNLRLFLWGSEQTHPVRPGTVSSRQAQRWQSSSHYSNFKWKESACLQWREELEVSVQQTIKAPHAGQYWRQFLWKTLLQDLLRSWGFQKVRLGQLQNCLTGKGERGKKKRRKTPWKKTRQVELTNQKLQSM